MVGMLLLLVAGLITTDVVTSSSLRSFLLGRLDEQIDASQNQTYNYISQVYQRDLKAGDRTPVTDPGNVAGPELGTKRPARGSFTGAPTPDPRLNGCGPGRPAQLRRLRRGPLDQRARSSSGSPRAGREPRPRPGAARGCCPSSTSRPRTCSAPAPRPLRAREPVHRRARRGVERRAKYRVQAVAVPGGTLVTAISLDPTDKTLASLTHVELIVSIAVMIALLLLALWIVRLGMRPLDDMTETAGAIAGGDLTRRIRRADDRSEVGRLGSALNGMLSQIEAAFGERTSSEARLRRFVADASHELRTPLTSIRGYAELLRKGAFDTEDDRRRAAERIEGEAARMSLLVDDLLLLARLDQGRPLDREPGRPVPGRRRRRRRRPDQRPRRGRSPSTSADPVVVQGDAARLRQIVDNLLHNAVVHTPPGTPVHVAVMRDGSNAVVRVADEGPGLDAEQAAHVFDRFYRGSEARTGEGTGLGLSIVAALAAAHGGQRPGRERAGGGLGVHRRDPDGRPREPKTAARPQDHAVAETDARRAVGEPRWRTTSTLRPPFVVDRGRGRPGPPRPWPARARQRLGRRSRRRLADHRLLVVDRPGYGRSGEETLSIEGNAELLGDDRASSATPRRSPSSATATAAAWPSSSRRAGPSSWPGLVLVGSIGRADSLNALDHLLAAPVMGEVLSAAGLFTLGPGAAPRAPPGRDPTPRRPRVAASHACPTSATTGSRRNAAGRCGGASWPSNAASCARSAPSRRRWARCGCPPSSSRGPGTWWCPRRCRPASRRRSPAASS